MYEDPKLARQMMAQYLHEAIANLSDEDVCWLADREAVDEMVRATAHEKPRGRFVPMRENPEVLEQTFAYPIERSLGDLTRDQLMKRAGIEHVSRDFNWSEIDPTEFVVENAPMKLIRFTRAVTANEAARTIMRLGLFPASAADLITFAATHPDIAITLRLVAPGGSLKRPRTQEQKKTAGLPMIRPYNFPNGLAFVGKDLKRFTLEGCWYDPSGQKAALEPNLTFLAAETH